VNESMNDEKSTEGLNVLNIGLFISVVEEMVMEARK